MPCRSITSRSGHLSTSDAFADHAPTVSFRRLLSWSLYFLKWSPGWFTLVLTGEALSAILVPLAFKSVETLNIVLNDVALGRETMAIWPFSAFLSSFDAPAGKIFAATCIFAILSLVKIAAGIVSRIAGTVLDCRLQSRLQSMLHDHILTLGPQFHGDHQAGELAAVISSYSSGAVLFARELFNTPITQGSTIAISIWCIEDSLSKTELGPLAKYALVLLLFILPISGYFLAKTLRRAYHLVLRNDIQVKNELLQTLDKPVEVHLMNALPQRSHAFSQRLAGYFRMLARAQLKTYLCGEFQNAVSLVAQVLFVFFSVYAYILSPDPDGTGLTLLAGSIVAFVMLVPQVTGPIQNLVTFYTGIHTSWPGLVPVYDVLEAKAEIYNSPGAIALDPDISPDIAFHNVTFGYAEDLPPVLAHVGCVFRAGRTTAIVASSGGGKTTAIKLINRLYDPWSGRITIGDRDLREIRLSSLRETIFTVSQFPFFLENSIRENFRLAKADVSDDEIREACEQVGLWDVLHRVAPGNELDYVLPKNDGLSGGQRRLLALSRGVLRQPRVLVLDEPTTGLSADSIQLVLASLRKIREKYPSITIIFIDHAMNFVHDFADQVVVLADGNVCESGTPSQLLASPGKRSVFRELWEDYNKNETS